MLMRLLRTYAEARLKFGNSSPNISPPPANIYHHADFPSLPSVSKSSRTSLPSRSMVSYEDLLSLDKADNTYAPSEQRNTSGPSYSAVASRPPLNKRAHPYATHENSFRKLSASASGQSGIHNVNQVGSFRVFPLIRTPK